MTIEQIIENSLKEDIGNGDHTSLATIPESAMGKVHLLIKGNGIFAGGEIAKKTFEKVDKNINFKILIKDGTKVKKGDIAFIVEGKSISILTAERTALNFLQRISGIATSTNEYVSSLEGLHTKILDTRKTTPLLRELEKYAVKIGGGENHRIGLFDMIMIKDNHIDFAGGIKQAIINTHKYLEKENKNLKIEIEVRNLDELNLVLAVGGINRIMLDNFTISDLKKAVEIIDKKYETEASGGITLNTIRGYAKTGVDYISVGALTHHIKSLDMSLIAIN